MVMDPDDPRYSDDSARFIEEERAAAERVARQLDLLHEQEVELTAELDLLQEEMKHGPYYAKQRARKSYEELYEGWLDVMRQIEAFQGVKTRR